MIRKFVVFLMVLALAVTLIACGEDEETTLTGMVVSVEGTVISLVEMDAGSMGSQRPEMPEGMEGFGGFNPDGFEGTLPEGETFPPREESGARPQMPNGEVPFLPEGETMPQMPEGMTMPENGQMPDFSGENGSMRPGFGNFGADMETKDIDITGAHISIEIDEGKAAGSMEDITVGCFVTITMNGKGEATYVLVSAQSFFGGNRGPAN